ncbi:MAG: hypothetical protein JWQ91_971 [Aeromicrobium sp.]|jgi:hypothetical protein|uniref:DUF1707 SHOCT-like domain-containing protein n=1 Tax=Aeromicrobium sp. TaxID=1871063 RepID=UPI002623A5CC|nr:DUF1707 domain-containing protein [Aeromicrobium sp.]MCW2824054.1 hypothetical protein [Aeromicrobium sp.]
MGAASTNAWRAFSADPRLPGSAELRATDADRDHAADVLREAYADGRLTRTEYDHRSGAALGARTVGDFLPLLRDLAPLEPARRDVAADLRAKAVVKYQRDLRDARNGWIFVSTVCLAIWAATSVAGGGPYFFWPVFPFVGVGIGYFSTRMHAEDRIEQIEQRLAETRRTRRQIDE